MRGLQSLRIRIVGSAILAVLLVAIIYVIQNREAQTQSHHEVGLATSANVPLHAINPPGKPSPAATNPKVRKLPAGAPRTKRPRQVEEGFSLEADSGGEDPRARANYFYGQRAYPLLRTPAGALQASKEQLETMITQQREMGLIPPALPQAQIEGQPLTNFPGPGTWTNIGPMPVTNSAGGANFGNPASTGRVTAIAVDPTPSATPTVYLGAATGGVWKSTDGGATWVNIFDQNKSLAIGGIGIAPSNHSVIYVGTGELDFSLDSYYGAGIYKSIDAGAHWTQQCGPAGVFCNPVGVFPFQGGGYIVGPIAVNPTDPTNALAAVRKPGDSTGSGIYRTTDGGTTWTQLASASGASGNGVVWNPTDNTVVYATLGQTGDQTKFGVYKSTDSGATFSRLAAADASFSTTNLGRHEIAVAPSNGNVIYLVINNGNTNASLLGFVKSTDGGSTWTTTLPGVLPSLPNFCTSQCWYDMAIAVHPTDPNNIIVGGSAFTNNSSTAFRSLDGGATWVDVTSGATAVRPHVDTHVMSFANLGGGNFRLFTGNDGGVWFTDNEATLTPPLTWQVGNNPNLVITQFYPGHAVHPSDENISFGGTQDNGTEKWSGAASWDHVTCGDGAWAAIDPLIPTTVYANCQNIAILRSQFDGTAGTWVGITNEVGASGDRSLFIPPLVQDPAISGRLYFGTQRVWQSMDFGNSWTPITADLTGGSGADVTSISVSPVNSNVVYATTSDGRVWRTTNANLAATSVWTNLTKAPLPNRYATEVRTSKTNADIAFLSYSGFSGFGDSVGHIFKTTDGGATWTDISGVAAGALPNTPVNDIAVDHIGAPLNFDAMFIATDVGVFECPDPLAASPCTTWSPVSTGLPSVPVTALVLRESSQTLRAATHGRGVWVLAVPGVNPAGELLLSSITPSSAAAGAASFSMTIAGNDFGIPAGTPVILVDGAPAGVVVNTVTPNQITATIPISVMASAGLHQISVSQPGHANTPSNPTNSLTFSVTGPAPTISLLAPNSSPLNGPAVSMTVTGTNFVCGANGSVVRFRTTALTPTVCSAISLTVMIPANQLTISGGATVRVYNSGPGGGLSGSLIFNVISPPPPNDNFANAIIINSVQFTDTEQTGGATTEIGEPVPATSCTTGQSAATHSVWYKYTPSATGLANFTTTGEGIDGVLQVVTGNSLGAFTAVPNGCDDEFVGVPENVTVSVTAGTTYYIMVSDWAGLGGTSVLNLVSGPSPLLGFDESAPAAPVIITAGATAHFTITITPQAGGFPGAITFSTLGVPGASTAVFTPPSVTPNGNTVTTDLAITTTVRALLAPPGQLPPALPSPLIMFVLAGAMMTLALALLQMAGRRRAPAFMLAGAVMILAAGFFTGCSKGSSGGGGGQTGTPAGTYTITVTGTSGTQSKTATITLTVQ